MIVITARNLCARPFLEQVGLLAAAHPEMIILREKDLSDDELLSLAAQCLEICERHNVPLAINSNMEVARELNICRIHLPMQLMKETEDFSDFSLVGASVHSVEQAKEAEDLGADYVLAGHVYHTACKDSDPRGVPFRRRRRGGDVVRDDGAGAVRARPEALPQGGVIRGLTHPPSILG